MKSMDNITTEVAPRTKVCKDCGRELPIEAFGKSHLSRDGFSHICKECKSRRMKAAYKTDSEPVAPMPIIQDLPNLSRVKDTELVAELRERGWDVKCTKMLEL